MFWKYYHNCILIGRSSDLSKFVKHGKEGQESFVEVDILSTVCSPSDKFITIRRVLNSENRGSKWVLNGKSSSQGDVKKIVSALSIDVDNLCSFMPQDKVGNFTRFNPKEMLENTLKAIRIDKESDRTFYDEQVELAGIENVKVNNRRELNMKKATLEAQKVELRNLEAEKERMRQRNEDKELLQIYELKKLLHTVSGLNDEVKAKQALLENAQTRLQDEQALIGPLEAKERELKKGQAGRARAFVYYYFIIITLF